jgi:sterol 3beta-glucosyltransferase
MRKPVILLTTGTRGDVQPYIALGLGLQAAGIPVNLASAPRFAALAAAYGLPFIAVEGNPSELITQPGQPPALSVTGSWFGSLRASLAYLNAARPVFARLLENAWWACQGAAALVIGLPTLWGAHIAEALSIPCIYGLLQPLTRTAAYPSALLPPGLLPKTSRLNQLSHRLVEQIVWQPWRTQINRWRCSRLQLPPAPWSGILARLYAPNAAVLYGISAQVVPPTADWPAHHHYTGFWFLPPPAGWQPPLGLERFLADGPPPVYLGFGSPGPIQPTSLAEMIHQVVDQTGYRFAASIGADEMQGGVSSSLVVLIDDVPHAWLFPRCSVLVHHGGSGTTAASLLAGIPTLVLPRATDQFFWGSRIYALGCGPRPLPQNHLTPTGLALALQQIYGQTAYTANSLRLSAAIRADNGVQNAVTHIQSWLN